jgi:hypothetical protein
MDNCVLLDKFSLKELKDICTYVQSKYFLLREHKSYSLCKFDLITILRNSKLFFEDHPLHLTFRTTFRGDYVEEIFIPVRKKALYRGPKIHGISFVEKRITLDFI